MTSHESIMGNAVMEGSQTGNLTATHMHKNDIGTVQMISQITENMISTKNTDTHTDTQIQTHTPVLGAVVFLL